MTGPGESIYRALLYLYPRAFRARYEDDLVAFFLADRAHPKYGAGPLRPIRFWTATLRDLVRAVWRARTGRDTDDPRPATARAGVGRPRWPIRADLRAAWRGMRATPGVVLSAVVLLALGIGIGTAMFSVVDAVVLRGLPFDEPDRLVQVSESNLDGADAWPAAWPNYAAWRTRQSVFSGMAASAYAGWLTTAGDEEPARLRAVRLTASIFDVLRVAPALGRPFTPADEVEGAAPVMILSDGVWRRRFGADPDIVGRVQRFEGGARTIVGVMPRGFTYPLGSVAASAIDVWVPIVPTARDRARDGGRTYAFTVVARLRAGVGLDQARVEMQGIRGSLATEFPKWFEDRGVMVRPMTAAIIKPEVRAWMLFLLGAVGVVLLVACLNVANLLLARAIARGREVAVRAALGASRWDLTRAFVTDGLLLAALGAAGGILIALWGVEVLRATLPDSLPRLASIAVDRRVLFTAAAAALATGVVFGLLPAIWLTRPNLSDGLRAGGRTVALAAGGRRARTGFVVAQVALATLLLAGAALFAASFARVVRVDLGFDPEGVVVVGMTPRPAPGAPRLDLAASRAMVLDALDRVRVVPGVQAATVIGAGTPLGGGGMTQPLDVPGPSPVRFTGPDEPWVHGATAAYLETMGATLVAGRWILETDTAAAPPVAVISDEAARRYFAGVDPLGAIIRLNDRDVRTVVGVVHGTRHVGPEEALRPEVFVPFAQGDQPSGDIVVRAAGDPMAVVPAVQAAIRAAVPNATLYQAETMEDAFARLTAQRRFNMLVLGLFGVLAVLIAAVGVYGLMAYVVSQRTREIGVRVALGAAPSGILRLVLGRASRVLVAGVVAGLAGALLLERFVRSFLFEARPHDPGVYAVVTVLLLAAGLLAAAAPARRAARVDPLHALRAE
ncbi:MAG: ABC transporter permease [Vicinamibacterales bacterium]